MVVKVQSIHFDADKKLLELVDQKLKKLEHFFNHILDIEVYLKIEEQRHIVKDKVVEFKVNVPGHVLFSKESSKNFEEAVILAYDSISRQIKDQKEKQKK